MERSHAPEEYRGQGPACCTEEVHCRPAYERENGSTPCFGAYDAQPITGHRCQLVFRRSMTLLHGIQATVMNVRGKDCVQKTSIPRLEPRYAYEMNITITTKGLSFEVIYEVLDV